MQGDRILQPFGRCFDGREQSFHKPLRLFLIQSDGIVLAHDFLSRHPPVSTMKAATEVPSNPAARSSNALSSGEIRATRRVLRMELDDVTI